MQILTLVTAGYYCFVVHFFRSAEPDNRALRERYSRLALILAAVTVGLGAARASGEVAALGAGVIWVGVMYVQVMFLQAAGALTLHRELVVAVVEAKKWAVATGALAGVPAVLLWTGVNPVRDQVLMYVVGFEAVALFVLFLVRTLRLFVRQKVSVLVWFLYLCTVEIAPFVAIGVFILGYTSRPDV